MTLPTVKSYDLGIEQIFFYGPRLSSFPTLQFSKYFMFRAIHFYQPLSVWDKAG